MTFSVLHDEHAVLLVDFLKGVVVHAWELALRAGDELLHRALEHAEVDVVGVELTQLEGEESIRKHEDLFLGLVAVRLDDLDAVSVL